MSRVSWLLSACVACLCVLVPFAHSNEPQSAPSREVRYDSASRGDLAVSSAADGPWRIVSPGEILTGDLFLRTSAVDACRLELPETVLQLAAETRVQLKGSQVRLQEGRIFLNTRQSLTVSVGSIEARLAEGCAVECESIAGRCSVRVVKGSLVLGEEPVALGESKSATWSLDKPQVVIADLPDGEKLRIEKWAAPPTAQGVGQLLIEDAQQGSPTRLNLAHYHVNVVLHPPVALLQIDQSFFNPFTREEEGTFLFNLPQGASVSRFAMFTTPQTLIEGELIELGQASTIYESIVPPQFWFRRIFQSDARSEIRRDLARESLRGAWATSF